jgi:hypothetical protein
MTMNMQERRTLGMPNGLTGPPVLGVPDVLVLNDEVLILDDRAEKRPAQLVEDKLSGMLKGRHRSAAAART